MFFLSDVKSVEFAKSKTKVKSYVRKGRIVRQHDRKVDIKSALLGGGIGILGVGTLTGAYLLGKGKVKPQQFKVDTDEIANKIISKLPKENIVNVDDIVSRVSEATPRPIAKVKIVRPKQPVQQTLTKQDVEDVVKGVLDKQPKPKTTNIDYEEIAKRLTASLPKQQIQTTSSVSNVVDSNLPVLPLKRVNLPIKIYKLSPKKIEEETKKASEMLDDELDIKINELYEEMKPFIDVEDQINSSKRLKELIEEYKKLDKEARQRERWLTEPKNLINKIGLSKVIDKDISLDKIDFVLEDDPEYLEKLKKQLTRMSKIKNIYTEELKKRKKLTRNPNAYSDNGISKSVDVDAPIITTSQEEIDRLNDFLSDFSAANDLVKFCKKMNQLNDSHLFFLSDLEVTFARRLGSKDKVKRMSRLGAGLRIGIPATIGAAIGGVAGNMISVHNEGIRSQLNNVNPNYKKAGIIGSLVGGTLVGGAMAGSSYLEHKASPYSPIGKKKWRNYPVEPKVYGIPVQRLSLIKGLDQQ
jgi:cell fate (sporulation/competence/biofilm development) regulator YmcA (YheA/YmcA/DUF963 family)